MTLGLNKIQIKTQIQNRGPMSPARQVPYALTEIGNSHR